MFSTGFSMNCNTLAESPGELTMKWMEQWSRKLDCVITGSIIASDSGNYYNRLIWIRPDGSHSYYDKRHLFRMANEHSYYSAGNTRLITTLKGWRICPLICYDLRFPVWSRNLYVNAQWDYDLLLYVANWPSERSNIWSILLAARAIENQSYVAGVNRIGKDGNNINYSGNSMVVGVDGKIIEKCTKNEAGYITISISRNHLSEQRERLGVGKDWDKFEVFI